MAQLRLPRVRHPKNPEGEKIAAWMEKTLGAMTPDELHKAIVDAVPELRRLPGNVRLVRSSSKRTEP